MIFQKRKEILVFPLFHFLDEPPNKIVFEFRGLVINFSFLEKYLHDLNSFFFFEVQSGS